MNLGSVVTSKSGHDKGKIFVVVEIVDENYVKIADGDSRKIANSKLKKIKHLKSSGQTLDKIAEKLENGVHVFDSELKRTIKVYKENINK